MGIIVVQVCGEIRAKYGKCIIALGKCRMNRFSYFILLTMAGVLADSAAQENLSAQVFNAGDQVQISVSNQCAMVTVSSSSGIGQARLTISEGMWPTNITVRFFLRSLENFEAWTVWNHVEASLRNPSPLIITKGTNCIDVELPMTMFTNNPHDVQFKWIEWYRM